MVLTVYPVLSPVIRLSCHRHRQIENSAGLTPTSRRQDHTPSPSVSAPFVKGASTSTASRPAFVTIASRPSWGRDGNGYTPDLGALKIRIFLVGGLTLICPTDRFWKLLAVLENLFHR
jgi:hypothetical protein